jgi:hypothetical protein
MRYFLNLLFVLVFIGGFAQSSRDILKRDISFEVSNERLEDVLFLISNEAKFNFSYNAAILNGDSLVTLRVVNSNVGEVLRLLLPKDIEFKVSGNHLILLSNVDSEAKRKKTKYTIRGYIYDKASGEPLPRAAVYEVNGLISAITDEEGQYVLTVPMYYEQLGIAYSKNAFSDTVIIVEPVDQDLDIYLNPKISTTPMAPMESTPIEVKSPVESVPIVKKIVSDKLIERSENLNVVEKRTAQVSFVPVVGTNLKMSGLVENNISLNILAGYAYGLRGFELGGLFNVNRMDVSGFQVGGLGNLTGGTTGGFQFAGLFNHNRGSLKGVQIAGINNLVVDTLKGVQFAGINNILKGGMKGWQLSGINNITTRNVDGLQLAGLTNFAKGDVRLIQIGGLYNSGKNVKGVQFAGLVNRAKKDVRGLQIAGIGNAGRDVNAFQVAGITNIARGTVKGLQLSGIFNYARHTRSSQIALINYADSASGIPFGFLSIIKNGYHKLELSVNETTYGNLAFKSGVRRFYNIFTAGIGYNNGDIVWSYGYGIGTEKKLVGNKTFHFDYTANWVNEGTEHRSELSLLNRLSFNVGWNVAKIVNLSIGPAINIWLSEWIDPDTGEHLTRLAPYTIVDTTISTTLLQIWVGGKLGVRFF